MTSTYVRAATTPTVIQLMPGVPVVAPANAPLAIVRATADLRRDLARVLGRESPLLSQPPVDCPWIEILEPDPIWGGPEAHVVRALASDSTPAHIALTGSDVRGVIYAIYTFSEKALGIPPLWFFADWKVRQLDMVALAPNFTVTIPSPQVRWRGWFPNDEDMYLPWEQGAVGERYDRVLETMLRLKLNVIDLGDIVDYPTRDALQRPRQAHDRGLALTTTHTNPLGTNWGNWEPFWRGVRNQEPPPLRLGQVKAMEEFWAHQIELCQREGFEMIWAVGFRGHGDHSFANAFPDAPPDAAGRAKVIGDMLRTQIGLLRAWHGNRTLRMRAVLYNEYSDYLAAGLLELPRDPDLIWNYVGARRDHFPAADIRRGDLPPTQPYGYYLNLQFTSTGAHLAPAEGPWKIARNYEIVAAASQRRLDLWIVNSGNTREFLQELSAHAALAWAPAGWDTDRYLRDWCALYFGNRHAHAAAEVIGAYYNSYWSQRAPDLPAFPRQYIFQDMRVARACEDILDSWTDPAPAPALDDRGMGYYRIDPAREGTDDPFMALALGLGRSVTKLAAVTHTATLLEAELDARGQRLWHDHVRVPAHVVLAVDRALLALLAGYRERRDEKIRRASLRAADTEFAEARAWLSRADQPPFRGWSEPETLWGISVMRGKIVRLLAGEKVIRRERP